MPIIRCVMYKTGKCCTKQIKDAHIHVAGYNRFMPFKNFLQYLTYSDDDLKWQIICTDVGSSEVKPYESYPPHMEKHPLSFKSVSSGRSLNEYQVIYITKGHGTFESMGKKHKVIPGTIIFLFPGVKHTYKPDFEIGWNEYWVGFSGQYPDVLMDEGVFSPEEPIYYIGLHETILSTYHDIFERVKQQRPGYQLRTGAAIMMLIADILGYSRQSVQHGHTEALVEKAKFFFEEKISENIELDDMAEVLGVSSSHLGDIFKSYTGMSPYQYFLHLKINKAKELLEIGELSIKEIAFQLSFESQYYFSRLFKKKTGVPPSQWTILDYENISE
jgi:AraC-like DNA-binding protein